MSKRTWLIKVVPFIVGFLVVAGGLVTWWINTRSPNAGGKIPVVTWKLLAGLDYVKGEAPSEVKRLNDATVRVPGFLVPLEDASAAISEFLLVPDPGACIHTPPPPPNQMIYVKMKNNQTVEFSWNPIWIEGELKISTTTSPYGQVSYEMSGTSSTDFKSWKQFDNADTKKSGDAKSDSTKK